MSEITAMNDVPLEVKVRGYENDELLSRLVQCWSRIEHYRFTADYDRITPELDNEYHVYFNESIRRMENTHTIHGAIQG